MHGDEETSDSFLKIALRSSTVPRTLVIGRGAGNSWLLPPQPRAIDCLILIIDEVKNDTRLGIDYWTTPVGSSQRHSSANIDNYISRSWGFFTTSTSQAFPVIRFNETFRYFFLKKLLKLGKKQLLTCWIDYWIAPAIHAFFIFMKVEIFSQKFIMAIEDQYYSHFYD